MLAFTFLFPNIISHCKFKDVFSFCQENSKERMIFFGHFLDYCGVFGKIHSEIVSFLCGWSENRRFLCKFVAAMVRMDIVEI